MRMRYVSRDEGEREVNNHGTTVKVGGKDNEAGSKKAKHDKALVSRDEQVEVQLPLAASSLPKCVIFSSV